MKARRTRSQVKTMVTVFFDSRSLIHHEFVPLQGQTVTSIITVKSWSGCFIECDEFARTMGRERLDVAP